MPRGSSSSWADAAARNRSHLTTDQSSGAPAKFPGIWRSRSLGPVTERTAWRTRRTERTGTSTTSPPRPCAPAGADTAAAAAFVRATQADVWRLCAHLGSVQTADDLTQDTYARAFGSLHRFAGRSSARTWLFSIARRVCADAIRSAQRERRLPAAGNRDRRGPRPARSPSEPWCPRWTPTGATRSSSPRCWDCPYAEAAEVCGCPVGTIRSRVARARGDLLDGLGLDGRGGSGQSRTSTG